MCQRVYECVFEGMFEVDKVRAYVNGVVKGCEGCVDGCGEGVLIVELIPRRVVRFVSGR